MDASILIVGNNDFLTSLRELIQGIATFSIERAPNPTEAMPLIQAQQPDILVLQAMQQGALDLCSQIKSQSRLAWIYCIVVDEPSPSGWAPIAHPADPLAPPHSALPHSVPPHSTLLPECLPECLLERYVEALEAGADAFLPAVAIADQPISLEEGNLRLLQSQISVGLRRVKNHRELMRTNDLLSAIALSDPLTSLNNRRAFEWELPRQIQNARSRNMPISLIMLDVDHFKSINDTYGHMVGDRALQLLGARLRHNLRFYDTPFRYGGEEFVIILSDTGGQEAVAIAHRICRLISEQVFVVNETLDLTITVSAGASSLRPEDDSKGMSLLHRADQYLLSAKSSGRNRVVSDI